MKTLILIIKGILLYYTLIITAIIVCSIDSIVEQKEYLFLIQDIIFILLCIVCISEDDFETLTLYKYQKKLFKDDEE